MMLQIVLALILSFPSQTGTDLLDLQVQPHLFKTMDSCIAAGKAKKEADPKVKGWICMYTTEEGTKS
jgi:hypothetical protein